MSLIWSVILNRMDSTSQVWKEWRAKAVSQSTGAVDAGAVPLLGPNGVLDASLIPSSATGAELSTNGTPNTVQDALDLIAGTNVSLVADNAGGVTISASGNLATDFGNISTGRNTTASMTVASGSSIQASGGGTINATEINGIPITGTLTHAGQIPISQPGNESAVWADPLVQGLQAVGTSASTVNPVLIGGVSGGLLTNLNTDASGNVNVNVLNELTQPAVYKTGQALSVGNTILWSPTNGKKFRLQKYIIEGTLNVSQSNQGVLTLSFVDGSTTLPIAHDVYVPSTAMKLNSTYSTGWIDLGGTGFLSASAGNGLSINLSAALTSGNFRINVCGTEE